MRINRSQLLARCFYIPAAILAVLLVAGCHSVDPGVVIMNGSSSPDTRVVLVPGDELDIRFYYTPDLNDVQVIRADGMITLQLLGDVKAAGMTPQQLQKKLEGLYTGLIENPSVAVIARDLQHRNIYVGGSVNTPGVQPMPGHLTVLEAIMLSGGFNMREADTRQVLVIRTEGWNRVAYSLDFSGLIAGQTLTKPFYLHPQDVVYVQRSGAVKSAQWIDQHIASLVPVGFTYLYNTGTGDSTVGVDTGRGGRRY